MDGFPNCGMNVGFSEEVKLIFLLFGTEFVICQNYGVGGADMIFVKTFTRPAF